MDKKTINEQANIAFEFMNKLYFETSYFIKEVEGLLKKEEENFNIGRTRGYSISVGTATGLEYPDWWWYKKFSVFFVQDNMVETKGGRTTTTFQKGLKIIYLMVVLTDKGVTVPKVAIGVLHEILCKSKDRYGKFEDSTVNYLDPIWQMAHKHHNFSLGSFEDNALAFKGKFIVKDLFDINSTQDIQKKLLEPTLKQFRNIK